MQSAFPLPGKVALLAWLATPRSFFVPIRSLERVTRGAVWLPRERTTHLSRLLARTPLKGGVKPCAGKKAEGSCGGELLKAARMLDGGSAGS